MKSVGRESRLQTTTPVRQTTNSTLKYWTYSGVGLQSGLEHLWFCTISKRHFQTHFLGNSLEVTVCAL